MREHGRTSRPCCVRIANCCVTSNEPATRPGSSHWHTWLVPFPLKPRKPTPCAWSTSLNVCWRTPRAGRVLCSTGNRHGSLLMLSRYGSATRCGSFHREGSLAQQVVSPGVVGSDNSRRRPGRHAADMVCDGPRAAYEEGPRPRPTLGSAPGTAVPEATGDIAE